VATAESIVVSFGASAWMDSTVQLGAANDGEADSAAAPAVIPDINLIIRLRFMRSPYH
jgi:hypothetical protein